MDVPSIKLSNRTVIGKKVKVLRRQGIVPVHVYGNNIEATSLQIDAPTLNRVLSRVGANIPLSVEIEGRDGENVCFIREVQRHPVSEDVLHVDFLRVDVTQTIRAEVPIILTGNAPAVRNLGGVMLQPILNLLVEALPMNMPPFVPLDVTGLEDFEIGLYVRDLEVSGDVTVINNSDALVARVAPPRIEVVEGAEAVAEEGVEGEEGAAEEGAEGTESAG